MSDALRVAAGAKESLGDTMETVHLSGPEQQKMDDFTLSFLNVPGLALHTNGREYQYKLPYVIQLKPQGCCTPHQCYQKCCRPQTGPADAMDMVDMDSGDQIRYHRQGKKVYVFRNGQYEGRLQRTWRCLNRCRGCMEDACRMDVPTTSIVDKSNNVMARSVRPGKGCCCVMKPTFPCRRMDTSFFYAPCSFCVCLGCTCELWPSREPWTGCPLCLSPLNGLGDYMGMPHNFICCDPVCCQCCVRGKTRRMGCDNCPCLCCPNPFKCCISCCCATCETKALPMTRTFRYEQADINGTDGQKIGAVQLQYRGNAPFKTPYMQDPNVPFAAACEAQKGSGLIASALLFARSYGLGLNSPLLSDVEMGLTSPDYSGWVYTKWQHELDSLVEALDENNVVTKRVRVGDRNVHGYTLHEIGWDNSILKVCGCLVLGSPGKKPVDVADKRELMQRIDEGKASGPAPKWQLRFFLADPEKDIISRATTKKSLDKKFYDFYYSGIYERVYCACTIIRFCACPCNLSMRKNVLCKVPCYVRPRKNQVRPEVEEDGGLKAPNMVVMTRGRKHFAS